MMGDGVRGQKRLRRIVDSAVVAMAVMGVSLIGMHGRQAHARGSVWAKARQKEMGEREAQVARAEELIVKYRSLARMGEEPGARMGRLYLHDARKILEDLAAERATDLRLRFRLAETLQGLREYEHAAKVLESILRADASAPLRLDTYRELAVVYARLGRPGDELGVYDKALSLEPHGVYRSVMLANRAEALMGLGRLDEALDGYREALRVLLPVEMIRLGIGVTTFWGLGVALDRNGDIEGAMETIKLARTYDPEDRLLNGPGWFYSVAHDEAWYAALGFWAAARSADLGAVRAYSYARAIGAWEEYIARAPEHDRYLPIARARLRACERERDVAGGGGSGRP